MEITIAKAYYHQKRKRKSKARPQTAEATGEVHPLRAGPYAANMFPSHSYIHALQ